MKVLSVDGLSKLISLMKEDFVESSSLSTVATSGSYNDLTNKPTIPEVDQTYSSSSTSTNALSHKAVADAKFLQNSATVLTSLTLLGTPTNKLNAINIGGSSSVSDSAGIAIGGASTAASYGISIGYSAYGSKLGSIALGSFSYATAIGAIQLAAIGNNRNVNATNSEAGSFYVALYDGDSTSGNYKLLGANGKIPDDRLNTTIARTSQIPTVDQTYDRTSSNAQSGIAINGAGFLTNKGAGSSVFITSSSDTTTPKTGGSDVVIGYGANAATGSTSHVAIGTWSEASYNFTTALGTQAKAKANYAIQIGQGTNSEANSLYIGLSDSNNYKLLGSDGTIPNARLNVMTGADGTNTGTKGAVPAPAATDNTKFLRGDGTWATVSQPSIATTSTAGLVKPDGATITVTNDGTISASSSSITFRTWSV